MNVVGMLLIFQIQRAALHYGELRFEWATKLTT